VQFVGKLIFVYVCSICVCLICDAMCDCSYVSVCAVTHCMLVLTVGILVVTPCTLVPSVGILVVAMYASSICGHLGCDTMYASSIC
jgi:hypothetical protein